MADESKLRISRSDGYDAGERSGRGPNADPLSELARLIGQGDPFEQMRRDVARGGALARPASDPVVPMPAKPPRAPWEEDLRGSIDPAIRRRDTSFTDSGHTQLRQPATVHPVRSSPVQPEPEAMPELHQPQDAPPTGTDEFYADGPADQNAADPHAEAGYQDDYADDQMEHAAPEKRRGGLITVAAVLGLAVIGTAGAFGYRALTSGGESAQPPVIKADNTPAKIVPAVPTRDGQVARTTFDRSEKPQPERLGKYEEQPIEMKDVKAAAAPKMVTSTGAIPVGGAPSPAMTPPPASPGAQMATVNPNEPKKVKTIPIRPDGTIAPETTASTRATGSTGGPSPRPAPVRPTGAQPAPGGPLAIAPQPPSIDPIRPSAGVPGQLASRTPGPAATPTTGAAATGSHVVQLASQKTEAEAQASFRALQAKYPTVLGSRQPMIRRVELGDRGTYYRAQVGPFASIDQANELCSSLKAAGGQCIVQRN